MPTSLQHWWSSSLECQRSTLLRPGRLTIQKKTAGLGTLCRLRQSPYVWCYCLNVTVPLAHAWKREHLVLMYENILANICNRPGKFVWLISRRDTGEVLAERKFNHRGDWFEIEFYWRLCHQVGTSRSDRGVRNVSRWTAGGAVNLASPSRGH